LDLIEVLQAYETARAARPGLSVSKDTFARHLSDLLEAEGGETLVPVSTLHVADIYLACGCMAGDERSIAAFEAECISQVPMFVRSMRLPEGALDEIKQVLRTKLLVAGADGSPPRIRSYGGRGKLTSWVRVAALRAALDLCERAIASEPATTAVAIGNPELDFLRLRYRAEFERAARDALGSLPDRTRALLRLQYSEGLNGEQIGMVYGVNRSTVSRWLASAHADLLAEVKALLLQRVALTASEVDSLAKVLVSQLTLSGAKLLEGGS